MGALEVEIFKVRRAPTSPKSRTNSTPKPSYPQPLAIAAQGTIQGLARLLRSPSACALTERHPVLQAVSEKSGKKEFTFNNAQVTPKESLWTACIDVTV